MSTADQLALGITLGHEAHRDGLSGQDNYLETRSAVTGHTEMAIRMLRDGQGLSMSANLQNDIGAYMMGQDVFNAYADGSYDSSGDYWKLTADGDLIDDNRKSLYIEAGNGDEFCLWDLENYSDEESFNKLFNVENGKAGFSEEAVKRVGLYTILNNASNLTEDKFNQIALTSHKVRNNLGYYIDFSILEGDMKYLENPVMISKQGSVMMPSEEMIFNPGGGLQSAAVFGTLAMTAGLSFSVSESPFYNNMSNVEQGSIPENMPYSVLEKAVNSIKTVIHNPYGPSQGKPTQIIYTESSIQAQVQIDSFQYTAADTVAMLSQFVTGTQQGIDIMSVGLPQWNFGDLTFFTLWKPELTSIEGNTFNYTPKFQSVYEMYMQPINKYNNYLGMPPGRDKQNYANWNNFWGW